MRLSRELMTFMLENDGDWALSPVGLLNFIVLTDHISHNMPSKAGWNINEVTNSAKSLGSIFLQAIPLNISPFKDFEELATSFKADDTLKEKMEGILKEYKRDQQLHKLSSEIGIAPSRETIAVEKSMRLIANAVIEKLSVYIEFED